MNPKVLIVASDFPPMVGTNTQRIQSFVRHLPNLGWEPIVVTQAIEDLSLLDLAELERVPAGTRVIRIPNPDFFSRRARRYGRDAGSARVSEDNMAGLSPGVPSRIIRKGKTFGSHVLKWLLRTFSYHPDPLRGWAERAANEVLRNFPEGVDAILSSSPAYSCHLAGLKLKLRTGLPWVADFRDLWVDRPYRRYYSQWHRWMDSRLEARVVAHCDALLVASPAWVDVLTSRYGRSMKDRITVLTNGYEAEHLDPLKLAMPPRKPAHKFVLTGSMHEAESPLPFLAALEAIGRSNPVALRDVSVELIGDAGHHLIELQRAAMRTGLGDRISFLPPRSNEACLRAQLDADYLIMFSAAGHADTIRGKTFEYMATGKPILACIARAGVQEDILKQAGTAIIVEHGDIDATSKAILRLLSTHTGTWLRPNWQHIRRYDRSALAAEFARTLSTLTSGTYSRA